MRDILLTLVFFSAIPAVFKWPWMGILLFSWISYMNPHRLAYGFAFNFQYAMIAALVTIIAFTISREPKKIPVTPVTGMLILFILWTSITTITALAPEEASAQYTKFLKIQLMTFLTLALINTREKVNWLIIMIVISLGFYGVRGGIFSILTGGNYRVWGPPGTFFGDNNHLALTLIMTLPFMHYLQLIATNKWIHRLMSVVMLLTLGAIIGTYSRGALLALTAMGGFMWLRSSKKLPVALAALICIGAVLTAMPQQWFDRMNTINTFEEDASASGRFDSWLFAINIADDRVLGGGFKVNTRSDLWPIYNPDAYKPRSPHSIYFEVLGEHGYIGLTIFLTLCLTAYLSASRTSRLVRHRPDLKWASDLSKMMQVSMVGYGAAGAFLNLSTFDLFYHVLAIIVIARLVVRHELAKADAPQVGNAAENDEPMESPLPEKSGDGRRMPHGSDAVLGGASGYLIKRR